MEAILRDVGEFMLLGTIQLTIPYIMIILFGYYMMIVYLKAMKTKSISVGILEIQCFTTRHKNAQFNVAQNTMVVVLI